MLLKRIEKMSHNSAAAIFYVFEQIIATVVGFKADSVNCGSNYLSVL